MNAFRQLACLLMLLFLLTAPSSLAQIRGVGSNPLTQTAPGQPQLRAQQQIELLTGAGTPIVAEGAIDAAEYVVGPGDQFGISIGGPIPIQTTVVVSAEGILSLIDAGTVAAAGQSLEQVRQQATEQLRAQYQNVTVDVNLSNPRQFYVHVSGAVPQPGRYVVLPLARLDDAVQQAFAAQAIARPDPTAGNEIRVIGSAASEIPQAQDGYEPSLRNVSVTRRDGTEHNFDLFRYYVLGDLDHNPYLHDGDRIRLSYYKEDRDYVLVTGDVASPGSIEHRPGDTILDVLSLMAGETDLTSLETVRLTRRSAAGLDAPMDLSIPEILQRGPEHAMPVQPGDHLNVTIQESATAAIYGFVHFPGTYKIENAHTTLRDLLDMAGGLKDEANVRAAYLERRQSMAAKPRSEGSDLDFFGRAYFRQSMAQNRLSIDIESALAPDADDVVLYSGDVVVFPRDENTVYVTGNVLKPGYIPFSENRTAQHYIDLAGGEAPLTTGIYIFEAGTGNVHSSTQHIIRPGDTIFINRESVTDNPELQALLITDETSKKQLGIARTQTIITGITALFSVVNTFLLIRDRL